jgi:hypothetical protein
VLLRLQEVLLRLQEVLLRPYPFLLAFRLLLDRQLVAQYQVLLLL